MVFIKMLQTKTAINASRAMRNDFIWPKFLFKSNALQPCLSNYTIPRVIQLKKIVLYCRQNARFPLHSSPHRKFQKCTALILAVNRTFKIDKSVPLGPVFNWICKTKCKSAIWQVGQVSVHLSNRKGRDTASMKRLWNEKVRKNCINYKWKIQW